MRAETCISSVSAALVLILISLSALAWGCGETRHTIRTIDQHATDDLSTMSTADERVMGLAPIYERREYIGTTFWSCQQQQQGQLQCQRVCDHGWDDDRLCSQELNNEFGEVNQPGAGVMATKYRRIAEERRRDKGEEPDDAEHIEDVEYADDDGQPPADDSDEHDGSDEPDEHDQEKP